LFNIRDARSKVEANAKLVELYETAFLPQAEEAAASAMKAYEAEKIDLLSLLDARRMLLDFKLDHYKAILELRLAFADLEKAVGIDINAINPRGINEKK
jgi:outer membrane protein TolC